MAASDYEVQVQKLYIAYYGRPADIVGLSYWSEKLNQSGGSLDGIINAFAESTESVALYGSMTTTAARITTIYQNILGRVPDDLGMAYYSGKIESGAFSLGRLALDVLNGATNQDAALIKNRLDVAYDFTNSLSKDTTAYAGDAASAIARTLLHGVSADTATVTDAYAQMDAYVHTVDVASAHPETFSSYISNGLLTDTSIVSTTLPETGPNGAPVDYPVFASATVSGSTLVMTYTSSTSLDAAHPPAKEAFLVKIGGVSNVVTAATVDATAKTVTLTLTTAVAVGNEVTVAYTDPTTGNDVNAIQGATGNDAASLLATAVTNNTPAKSIVFSTTTFTEAAVNDGSISTVSTLTLSSDTFKGTNGAALPGAVVTKVPAGLTAVVTKTSDTTATLTLTGKATAHANANDIANLTVTLGDTAFTSGKASSVTGATTSDLIIDFADPASVAYSPTTFTEAAISDGSISTVSTITLTGGTFAGTNGAALVGAVVTKVPVGLTAVVTKISDTTATLALTGKATAHANANDIANLTVTLGNTAFTSGNAATVTGATKADLKVDFFDASVLTYSGTTFTEATANDGSIATAITLTLVGETFAGSVGSVLPDLIAGNLPGGLSAVATKTGDSTATLTLTGQATNHAVANDISNLTIAFGNAAFTGGNASIIANTVKSGMGINFADPATIAYSDTTFNEAVANNGTIANTLTITLAGDTFTGSNLAPLAGAVVSNVPAGLTAIVTRTSATTATVTRMDHATHHANSNDISSLTVTLGNAAFTSGNAAGVIGATKSNLAVDFSDSASIAYSVTTFSEAVANDGSISTVSTLTLTGDTFTGVDGADWSTLVSNVPAGLTASLIRTDATHATLSFTDNAAAHTNAEDIANLAVNFTDSYFTNFDAVLVVGSTINTLTVDFAD